MSLQIMALHLIGLSAMAGVLMALDVNLSRLPWWRIAVAVVCAGIASAAARLAWG